MIGPRAQSPTILTCYLPRFGATTSYTIRAWEFAYDARSVHMFINVCDTWGDKHA